MIRLTTARRRVLIAHVPELANVGAGSLLFGQFLNERPYSLALALGGVVLWFLLIGVVLVLAEGERK